MKKILLLTMVITACAGRFADGPCGGWSPMMHWGFGGMFMGWFIFVIIIGLVVYIIFRSQDQKSGMRDTPMEILKKRYAKGEITKEDFDRMKKDLAE